MGHARSNRSHLKTDYLRCCCLIRFSDGTANSCANRHWIGTTWWRRHHKNCKYFAWKRRKLVLSILSALENVLQMHFMYFTGTMEFLSWCEMCFVYRRLWTQTGDSMALTLVSYAVVVSLAIAARRMLVASVENRAHATDMHIIQAIQMRVT